MLISLQHTQPALAAISPEHLLPCLVCALAVSLSLRTFLNGYLNFAAELSVHAIVRTVFCLWKSTRLSGHSGRPINAGHAKALEQIGSMAALPLVVAGFSLALEKGAALFQRTTWPQFEALTFYDGQLVNVVPPPGYIRIEQIEPGLREYLLRRMKRASNRDEYLVIEKLGSGRTDLYDLANLAWVMEGELPRLYTIEPTIPLAM